MKGSEKQIKWAKDIQAKALEAITETAAMEYAEAEGEDLNMSIFKEYRTKIETCEDATWFIDVVQHHSDESAFYWMEEGDEEESRETLEL